MKILGLILFIVMNGLFVTVIGAIDAFKFNPDDVKYTDQSLIIDVGNRFMENAPFSFEATTIVDIIFVFAGIAVLFLVFIYLVFEIYLFINFMSSRNKPTIK
jgi:hypothetical protein